MNSGTHCNSTLVAALLLVIVTPLQNLSSKLLPLQLSVIRIVLVQSVERTWLRLATATVPSGCRQSLGRIGAAIVSEDRLESLGPLHTVVQALQTPEILQEMHNRAVGVGRVLGVRGALIMDESVGLDERRNQECRDAMRLS